MTIQNLNIPQASPSLEDLLITAIVNQKAVDKNGIQIKKFRACRIAEIALKEFSQGVTILTHFTKDELGLNVAMMLLPERKLVVLTGHEIGRGSFKKALDALQIDFSEEGLVKVEKIVELRIKGENEKKYKCYVNLFKDGEKTIETIGSPHLIGKSLYNHSYLKKQSKKKHYLERFVSIVRDEGIDLEKFIKGQIAYSQTELIQILKGVAKGLIDMHSKRVVHKDLKAANILVKKLTGVIADLDSAENIDMAEGVYSGTPLIQPPEVILANIFVRADLQLPEADCWAFGFLIYSLFHPQRLRPPYARVDPTEYDLFHKNMRSLPQIPAPNSLFFDWKAQTKIEKKVQDLICELFMKDPRHRMTAAQALAALENIPLI